MAQIGALLVLAFAFAANAAPLKVVATTSEMRSLAEAVGGDRIVATALIPPGVDGEAFQPRPQDLALLRDASIVVRVGADYDLWLDGLLRQSGNAGIQRGAPGYVDASMDVALLDVRAGGLGDGHAHGRGNPHYWLDPVNAQAITGTMLEAFARVDPANAKRYESNRLAFLSALDARMEQWHKLLRRPPVLIAYHDTWPYLARRFRLRFVGIVEARPGIPAGPAHLAQLARTASTEHVAGVVREPHEPARDAEFVAAKAGTRVAVLASGVGVVPEAHDYLSLIDYNVRTLAALR